MINPDKNKGLKITLGILLLLPFMGSTISADQKNSKADREDILSFDVIDEINTLQIDSFNGKLVLLTGTNSSRIQGVAKTWAYGKNEEQAQDHLEKISWKFKKTGKTLKLKLDKSSLFKRIDGGSDITALTVPAKWNLDLDTSNGSITISSGFSHIIAQSSNGKISIEGGDQVIADTSNGSIKYSGSAQDFDLESSNGKVRVQLNQDWNGSGKAESSNGNITVICSGIIDARLSRSKGNGNIFIHGPALSKTNGTGELSLETSNGNISISHNVSIL